MDVYEPLIADIVQVSQISLPAGALGQHAFGVRCLVTLGGATKALTLGRPFGGFDYWLWGWIDTPVDDGRLESERVEIDVARVQLEVRRMEGAYGEVAGRLTLEELVFVGRDGRRLRIFGDIDEFEVPCVNCDLVAG